MELQKAIEYALSGNAILFLGSGASVGAINQNNETFPVGKELANRLYSGIDDLNQAAEFFCEDKENENKDGQQELIEFLKRQFRAKNISEYQKLIPSIPWKRIYTTNYDNIVEKAYNETGMYIRSLVTSDDPCKYISNSETVYLHINGSINKLNKETLNDQFKLTDYSYNTNVFEKNEWGTLFKHDLNTYSVAIFIGFSMNYDLDIRRIISTINKDKCVFIVCEDESPNTVRMLKKYGDVECIGLDNFFEQVVDIQKDFDCNAVLESIPYSNFETSVTQPAIKAPNDSEVLAYYKVGKKVNELYYEQNGNYKAIVKRMVVEGIVKDIENGTECIFIHSDIGNGKTEVVEQICYQLSSRYNIYKLIDNNEKLSLEIEEICSTTDKKIVIIENFFNYYEVFQMFKIFNSNKNITFIFTARTSIYKSRYETFLLDTTKTYDLNRLKDDEITNLVNIFNEYGYYPKEKMTIPYELYIKKMYNSKLQAVLLGIFENESIANALNSILVDIKSLNKNSLKILTLMILIKVMNLDLKFDNILDLLSLNGLDYEFEKSDSINELVNIDGSNTSIKSVTICMWMLPKLKNKLNIFDVLIEAALQADVGYRVSRKYENFLGNIISYKHLKFVLNLLGGNNVDKLKYINKFYQSLKNLSYYKDKYFFWLQYGISALELNDYESAEHHFNAALTKIHGDIIPFEINNQYARLKMDLMLVDSYKYNSSTYQEFVDINKLLKPTLAKEDDEYYCYKMSSSYYPKIFAKFYSDMTDDEQNGLKQIAAENSKLCFKYITKNKNEDFKRNIQEFISIYSKLSNYSDDTVKFHVAAITRFFAYGKVKIKGEEKPACIHISQISNKYVKSIEDYMQIGQWIDCSIVKYNEKHQNWELSCK